MQVKVKKEQRRSDVADFWYQCWGVHGILEEKNADLNCKRFFALHNNKFVQGTSREACESRIVIYVFSTDCSDFELEIDGKKPTSYAEYRSKKTKKTIKVEPGQLASPSINFPPSSYAQYRTRKSKKKIKRESGDIFAAGNMLSCF